MKKTITLMLSLVLVGSFSLSLESNVLATTNPESSMTKKTKEASKADFYDNGLGYKILADTPNEVSLVAHQPENLSSEIINIAETVTHNNQTYTVSEIGYEAFSLTYPTENTQIKEITIPKTVKSIEERAFLNVKLDKIALTEGLEKIGAVSIAGTNIKELIIPESVTEISQAAFSRNTHLVNVSLPTNSKITNTMYAMGMFQHCTSLKTITLPDNWLYLPQSMFEDCTSLKDVKLSKNIQSIGDNGFRNTGLETFKIDKYLSSFSQNVFWSTPIKELVFAPRTSTFSIGNINEPYFPDENLDNLFTHWLASDGTTYTHEELKERLWKGPILTNGMTFTAQPVINYQTSSSSSNAVIELKDSLPTGEYSFEDVANNAKIVFEDVTLDGRTQSKSEKTASKIIVNDSRSDQTTDWKVTVRTLDQNFENAGLELSFKPTSNNTINFGSETMITDVDSDLFTNKGIKDRRYETLLNAELTVPPTVTAGKTYQTNIQWTLQPSV